MTVTAVTPNSRPPGQSEQSSMHYHWERRRGRRRRMGLGMLAVVVVVVVVVLGRADDASVVDSQHAPSSSTTTTTTNVRRRLRDLPQRRQLTQTADKYHPDKDDVSCEQYFSNGTDPPFYYGDGDDRTRHDADEDRDGDDTDESFRPPPCREPSQEEDDDDNENGATVSVTSPVPVPLTVTTPVPVAAPAPVPVVSVTPIPSPTQSPTTTTATDPPSPSPTPPPQPTLSPTGPSTSTATESVSTSTNSNTEAPAPPQIYYTPAYAEQPDESLLQNIARVAISVAAPPAFSRGISHKEVNKAITKLLNVTSAMRSEELMEEFLELYAPDSSAASLARQILKHYPVDEIPHVIPTEQTLYFHLKYTNTFHRQQPDKADFWELVSKPAESIPIERIEVGANGTVVSFNSTSALPTTLPPSPNTTTNNSSTAYVTDHSTKIESSDLQLASWWLHPIYFRCYMRDQEGTLIPIEDVPTLQLIEEQMYEWVNFHVEFSNELLSKLQGFAVGVAMPGDEFDLYLVDGDWIPTPRPHGGSDHHTSATHDSVDDPAKEDDFFVKDPPMGTFTEPLIGGGEGISTNTSTSTKGLLETPQELLGLVVLCSTIAGTLIWSLISMVHRRRQMEHEVWGANMGTEHALQELLNVGWKVQDQHEAGQEPRQILVIYDKTEHGMGYREEDSTLMGGYGPPMFPGLTD